MSEPLTGRGLEILLLPFSLSELEQVFRPAEIDALFEFFIRFGLYPEIVDKSEKEAELLVDNLASKYLYRDILEFGNFKKPELLLKLLQLLAFQIGGEVSHNELSLKPGVSLETVRKVYKPA